MHRKMAALAATSTMKRRRTRRYHGTKAASASCAASRDEFSVLRSVAVTGVRRRSAMMHSCLRCERPSSRASFARSKALTPRSCALSLTSS